MKALCLLSVVLLASCKMVGHVIHHPSKVDPSKAEVVLSQSTDPNVPQTASLRLPGAAAPDASGKLVLPGTDADGAEAARGSLYDFASAFDNPGQNRLAHWRRSGADAIAEAKRKGLPLLIFFTHRSSNTAQDMDAALSSTAELTSDTPRFVPVRIDFSEKITETSDYYRSLRDRYKPRGFPVLILALPDGMELTRQTGCSKDWVTGAKRWLDDAASRAQSGVTLHRKHLEAQKYRLWKNSDGQEIFAKLESQDANKLVFTNEWGETIHTFVNRLSKADQERIESKQL